MRIVTYINGDDSEEETDDDDDDEEQLKLRVNGKGQKTFYMEGLMCGKQFKAILTPDHLCLSLKETFNRSLENKT